MKKFARIGILSAALVAALVATMAIRGGSASAASGIAVSGAQATGTPSTKCGTSVSCVIAFGNTAINERIASLQLLIARANARQHLTSDQRAAVVNSANTAITGLKALQTQLDGETVIANARTDVKNIYVQFRIYAVQIPSDYAQIWMDDLSYLQQAFTAKEPTIQQDIQKAGSPGNTTALYNDLVAQLTTAGTNISNGQALIPSLTPANYPATDQTLKTLKTDIQTAHAAMLTARTDLKQIIAALKAVSGATPTTTATPTS